MQGTTQGEPPQRGALEELAGDPSSRKKFFKATGTGAVGAFALFLTACGSSKKSTTAATSAASAGHQDHRDGDVR
jgi:hypothetical protein